MFLFLFTHLICRTFGDVWISMLKVHENIGNQRIKFAACISDSAEDLLSLGRTIERDRKKVKEITREICQINQATKDEYIDQRCWYAL
jgi:hypothetical protein